MGDLVAEACLPLQFLQRVLVGMSSSRCRVPCSSATKKFSLFCRVPMLAACSALSRAKFSLDYKGIQPGMAAQTMRTK
jgi:hypothetical protein